LTEDGRTMLFYPVKKPSEYGTMYPNRADAIKCTKEGLIFYADTFQASTTVYKTMDKRNDNHVIFNVDGTFKGRNKNHESNKACEGKNIAALYDKSMAFNLVSSNQDSVDINNNDDIKTNWPFAIDCSSQPDVKYMFYIHS